MTDVPAISVEGSNLAEARCAPGPPRRAPRPPAKAARRRRECGHARECGRPDIRSYGGPRRGPGSIRNSCSRT